MTLHYDMTLGGPRRAPTVVTRTEHTRTPGRRPRLEVDPEDPRVILTVWKAGYRVAAGPDDL